MKTSDAFPSRFIGKDDVKKPIVVHLARVEMRNVGTERDQEEKPVAEWQEPDVKPLILNSTNWEVIALMYGEESDEWIGKPVELYHDPTVIFRGRRVGGVRVRVPKKTEGIPF